MTEVTDLLDRHANRIADETMASKAITPNPTFLTTLQNFEANAPDVERLVFGGLSAKNAVTQRLQKDLGINPDGTFGPGTAAKVLEEMDKNDINLADYPELDSFISTEHRDLYNAYHTDVYEEGLQTTEQRAEIHSGLSTELSDTFSQAKTAILSQYYHIDTLRTDIDALASEGLTRDEIATKMMEQYNTIISDLPDSIEAEIREALELEGVDLDDFAKNQIAEVFEDIDAKTKLQNAPKSYPPIEINPNHRPTMIIEAKL